jgi:hypothetical protein
MCLSVQIHGFLPDTASSMSGTQSDKPRAWPRPIKNTIEKWKGSPRYDKIFFLHIPKTAGTAFSSIFEGTVPEGRFFEHMESQWDLFFQIQKDGKPFFLSGHFSFAQTEQLINRPDVFSFSLLREPFAQFISHLRWVKYVGSPGCPYSANVDDETLDVARQLWSTPFANIDRIDSIIDCEAGRRLFDNSQVRYLTTMETSSVDQDKLDGAISNLGKFHSIFTFERLKAARRQLKSHFPKLLKMKIVNPTIIEEHVPLRDKIAVELIEKYTRFDQTLYTITCELGLRTLGESRIFATLNRWRKKQPAFPAASVGPFSKTELLRCGRLLRSR